MINAIVQNKQGETAVIDLTVHYHEIYKELQSLGYYGSPERLPLKDEEDEEYSVKLYSDSDIGNSTISLKRSTRDMSMDRNLCLPRNFCRKSALDCIPCVRVRKRAFLMGTPTFPMISL